jgi:hypothetical protein
MRDKNTEGLWWLKEANEGITERKRTTTTRREGEEEEKENNAGWETCRALRRGRKGLEGDGGCMV